MRKLTVTVLVALVGLAGLAGCGLSRGDTDSSAQPVELAEALYPEAEALEAMGFGAVELAGAAGAAPAASADPSARPSGKADRRANWRKRHAVRVFVNRNVLHGEAVVQTKEGTRTIVVQRGTVTALTDTTLTVKSTDGFTLVWTFGDPLHVVEHRTTIQPSQIAVGAEVGVAGGKDGDKTLARLIVIPRKK